MAEKSVFLQKKICLTTQNRRRENQDLPVTDIKSTSDELFGGLGLLVDISPSIRLEKKTFVTFKSNFTQS